MFISRLELDTRNKRVLAEINSPYEMHRTFSKAFIFENDGPGRVLFRVEPDRVRKATVIVQSSARPDWDKLTVQSEYFYLGSTPEIKEFNPVFLEGGQYIFRMRANPTKRDNKSRKRIGIYDEAELESWLQRKAAAAGFQVITSEMRKEPLIHSKIKSETLQHRAQLHSVLFQGVLRVLDNKQFLISLAEGIGSGKGLGFGLLSVAAVAE